MHSQCRSNFVWNLPRNQKKKQKQSPSVAIFSQPNSTEDQKIKTKNKDFTPVCAILIRLIEVKTKAKRFCLTILLFVVLLWYMFFFARYLTATFEWRRNKSEKKVFPAYPVWGDAKFSIWGSQISMEGR